MSGPDLSPFSPWARQCALRLMEWSSAPSDALAWAAALVCHFRSEGHTCLPLGRVAGGLLDEILDQPISSVRLPELGPWIESLLQSGVVVRSESLGVGEGEWFSQKSSQSLGPLAPLVLGPDFKLYLHRYWAYEQEAATQLRRRAAQVHHPDPEKLTTLFRQFFPVQPGDSFNWQALAALSALQRGLTILSGGPGTGKTHTIAWHLGLLFALHSPGTPRVNLAAPTGKAAARLSEAIRGAFDNLPPGIPRPPSELAQASTLHRLLGIRPGTGDSARYAPRLLAADVVIVDEASMLDLVLLVRLLRALPDTTRLVLVGDQNQLEAVEAGSILGEVWSHPACGRYSSQWSTEVGQILGQTIPEAQVDSKASSLTDSLIELQRARRFGEESQIQLFSRAVRRGQIQEARAAWRENAPGFILQSHPPRSQKVSVVADRLLAWHQRMLAAPTPAAALAVYRQFRLLTPLRRGSWGVETIHQEVLTECVRRNVIPPRETWYPGRPILITTNSTDLELSNGDTGLALIDPDDGCLKVWFESANGNVRSLSPLRMPAHETAYAMTVHKSQGSEFQEILLVLPEEAHPLVNRELIYTAVTRDRQKVEIWATESTVLAGLGQNAQRHSGMARALWSEG